MFVTSEFMLKYQSLKQKSTSLKKEDIKDMSSDFKCGMKVFTVIKPPQTRLPNQIIFREYHLDQFS